MRRSGGLVGWVALAAAVGLHAPATAQEEGDGAPRRGSAVVLGTVVSAETGAPLPSTFVELVDGDTLVVASTDVGAEGRFRMERVPEGTFRIRLSGLGYGTVFSEPFEVAEAEERDLGELRMPVEAIPVDPITVSAERTVVTFEADRTAYNVGVMPGTEGASVTETLATIPELEVDIDGNVSLRGSRVAIYVNGRPSPMSGEALALFLEQFPADYLQKIEILDNPSARYDAEGSGGIVNLVMKEGVELGFSGSVFANAGTRGQYGVGGRGTLQRGEWTLNGGGFLRLSDNESNSFDLRQNLFVDPAYLRRDAWSDRSSTASNVDLEVRWEPTERTRFFVESRVSGSGGDSEGLTTTTHLDDLESPFLVYDRSRSADSRDRSFDVSTGFDFEWEPREHELEIELEYQRGSERDDSREEITDGMGLEGDALLPAELTLEDEHERETELSLDVDYTRPWGEGGEIEVGGQLERTDDDLDRLIRFLDEPSAPGVESDRGYDQRESSRSVYTTVQRRLGPVSVQAGLRLEQVELDFEVPDGDPFGRTYTDLFPSGNLSWRIDDDRALRLSYSRRVGRPGLSVLNPIDRSTDPLRREIGNPEIEPRFTHSVAMHASWSFSTGSLRLSPYWRKTTNDWSRLTTVDEDGISTRTYENLTSRESLGASVSYSLRRVGRWRGNVGVSVRREDRNASNLDERYSGSSVRVSTRANVNGPITDDLSWQGNFSYSPATDLPQGRSDARYRADFGFRYRMLDDRASVRVSLRDPFELTRSSSRLRDVDYVLIGRSEETTRRVSISVSYTLGGGGEFRGRRGR